MKKCPYFPNVYAVFLCDAFQWDLPFRVLTFPPFHRAAAKKPSDPAVRQIEPECPPKCCPRDSTETRCLKDWILHLCNVCMYIYIYIYIYIFRYAHVTPGNWGASQRFLMSPILEGLGFVWDFLGFLYFLFFFLTMFSMWCYFHFQRLLRVSCQT